MTNYIYMVTDFPEGEEHLTGHDQPITTLASERLERAHRILDAAAELTLRWGYNKTTIDDIAQHAGVGKGTIYLHWKTRDELFATLVRREQVKLAADFQRRIADDPEGARLGSLIKHTTLALMQRPLLKALVVGDTAVWGKLAAREQGNIAFIEKMEGFKQYLEFLRERQMVRDDLSVDAQVTILAAVTMGFFIVAPSMPEEYMLSDAALGDLIAETVRGALEPDRKITVDELAEASRAFLQYASHVAGVLDEQLRRELGA